MPTINGTNSADILTGTSEPDIINGLGGNDIIDGGAGADQMDGGTGDDIFLVDDAGDVVIEDSGEGTDEVRASVSYVLSANVENLVLTGIAAINGTGNSLNNRIIGNEAANVITGGGGSDVFIGGGGGDRYIVEATVFVTDGGGYAFSGVDQVVEEEDDGIDTVVSNATYTLGANVENLELVGDLNLAGFGNALDNRIIGNSGRNFLQGGEGDDYLDGGAGADNMYGGDGNDTYVIDDEQDSLGIESPGPDGGIDTVISGIDYTLGFSLENLTLTGAAVNGKGNHLANVIIGNGTANSLLGDGGNDTIDGSAGNDTIDGGFGDDLITGGAGADILKGGPGSDTFRDTAANFNGDTISDFGAGDRIVISDAVLGSFSYSLSGSTLSFGGTTMTLGIVSTGQLRVSAAAGGGVEIALVKRDVDNDFNGDGRSDVLWRNDGGTLTTWLGQHDGGFLGDPTFYRNFSQEWQVVGTGDFNGDGRDDILFRNDEGIVTDWLGLPIGGFVSNTANAFNAAGLEWHVVGTGDFNGDGRDDVLWRNDGGTVTTWLGQPDGGFVGDASVYENVTLDWHVVGTGDFNGDGFDDILWRNDEGIVTDWLGQSSGGFSENAGSAFNPAGLDWHVIATGDFNGDGRDDVLWRNDWGTVTSWLGQADGGFVGDGTFYTNVALDWQIEGTGDFNGDGFDDILWRNGEGIVTDWLGQTSGGFTPNEDDAYNAAGLDWHIEAPTSSQLDWGQIAVSPTVIG